MVTNLKIRGRNIAILWLLVSTILVAVNHLSAAVKDGFTGNFTGYGVWSWDPNTNAWSQKCITQASQLAMGDLDGNGKDDILGMFDIGLWILSDSGSWQKVEGVANPSWIATGDMNADGKKDILGVWTGLGVWTRYSGSNTWVRIHEKDAWMIGSGDFDKDGKDDFLGVWSADGIWVKYATGSWVKVLAATDLKYISAGDFNGDGQADLLGSWTHGVWYLNAATGSWNRLYDMAERVTAGDLDGDAVDDLIGVWTNTPGTWVRYTSSGSWYKIHASTATCVASGVLPAQTYYTLTINISGNGTVAKNPNATSYLSGTVVTLTATPLTGNSFTNWSGDLTGSTNPTSITMTGNKTVTATFTLSTNCSTPSYEPSYWNTTTVQPKNNCYNYSNNKRTDTFAQPGRYCGQMASSLSCSAYVKAAVCDGLETTTKDYIPTDGKTKIALVMAPGIDYHWYRKDSNGLWTHKPGNGKATNLDDSGQIISDPEAADTGMYTQFCGYFLTCSDAVQGSGHATIRSNVPGEETGIRSSATGLKVTVHIFSGRPDPEFTVTDPQTIKKIRDLLADMKQNENFTGETVVQTHLGYRGLTLENEDPEANSELITIYKSNIEIQCLQFAPNTDIRIQKEFRSDPGQKLENLLIQCALDQKVIDNNVAAIIYQAR